MRALATDEDEIIVMQALFGEMVNVVVTTANRGAKEASSVSRWQLIGEGEIVKRHSNQPICKGKGAPGWPRIGNLPLIAEPV